MHSNAVFDNLPPDFFYNVLEALGYEVFVCDNTGRVLYMNPASQYLTGRLKENVINQNVSSMVDDGTISQSVTEQVLKDGGVHKIIQKISNGKDLLIVGIPIFDKAGKLQYVVTTAQDVAELNALNNNLLQENLNLQHEMKTLNRLKKEYLSLNDMIYVGDVYESIINTLIKVAPLDVIVLIQGETGTGKEGIAKMVHQLSKRSNGPFVKINCGLIPENLFESELFGYEEGSFTGAVKGGKSGKIELANNGTLFLDEIGELPLSVQVKLLDFIQEKTITKIGSHKRIPVNTRIVAATHRDLKAMSEDGSFRQDLYYRLEVFPVHIPPLRDWGEDIIHLAQFFLYQCNKKYEDSKSFDRDIIKPLHQYNWPGNIRELEHTIERLYISADGNTLSGKMLSKLIDTAEDASDIIHCKDIVALKDAKSEIERQLLTKAYGTYHSSYQVAKALKIDQSTVIKLKKKHNI